MILAGPTRGDDLATVRPPAIPAARPAASGLSPAPQVTYRKTASGPIYGTPQGPTPLGPSPFGPGAGGAGGFDGTGPGGTGLPGGIPDAGPGIGPAGGGPSGYPGGPTGTGAGAGLGAGEGLGGGVGAGGGDFDVPPALSSDQGLGRGSVASAAPMIGDMSPPFSIQRRAISSKAFRPPPIPPPNARSLLAPSVRGFKIAENQSPVPQDRVFFNFSYYDDVNKDLNAFYETPIQGIQIYRYVWGFEKTFNQGRGSFGLRLPLNNVYARSTEPSLNSGGSSTQLGNLTVFLKHIFWQDPDSGSLVSGGLSVTPRTAPRQFAGAPFLGSDNTTSLQPFMGYFLTFGDFYLQGFEALDVPIDFNQPTLLYNDVAIGYFLYRNDSREGFIRSIAPTVEGHANIPLNHRGEYNPLDRFGTPDIVTVTSGLNVGLGSSSILTFGLAVPVTGPRPFDLEPQVLLNVYFGRSRRNPAPPVIGG